MIIRSGDTNPAPNRLSPSGLISPSPTYTLQPNSTVSPDLVVSTLSLSNGFVQKNQSWHLTSLFELSILSFAVRHDDGAGMMTSSPGNQFAGRATLYLSIV